MIVHIPEANAQLMEKFVIFAMKITISKFAVHVLLIRYIKLKRTNLMKPSIKNENRMKTDWSITLPSNGIPTSYKIDTGAQCNVILLTILKKHDLEQDLTLVKVKLSAYNNSKIPIRGKCRFTLKYKKDHFDV